MPTWHLLFGYCVRCCGMLSGRQTLTEMDGTFSRTEKRSFLSTVCKGSVGSLHLETISNKTNPILTIFLQWLKSHLIPKYFAYMGETFCPTHVVGFSSDLVFLWSHKCHLLRASFWVACAGGDPGGRHSPLQHKANESTWMMLHNVKGSSETLHFSSSRWLPVFYNSEFNKCMLASHDIP